MNLTGQPDEMCSQVIYVEPLDWFSEKIEELTGRVIPLIPKIITLNRLKILKIIF